MGVAAAQAQARGRGGRAVLLAAVAAALAVAAGAGTTTSTRPVAAGETGFDVQDFLGAQAYAVQFGLPTAPAEGQGQAAGAGEVVQLGSVHGQQFRCRVPHSTTGGNAQHSEEAAAAAWRATNFTAHLAKGFPKGSCIQKRIDWWTYKLCFRDAVTQFHEPDGRQEDPALPDVVVLGRYNSSRQTPATLSPGDRVRVNDDYVGGTVCDLTGKPRRTTVAYTCDPQGTPKPRVLKVEEVTTCSYLIHIGTALLCHERVKAAVSPIQCEPLDDQGQVLTPAPDSAAAVETTVSAVTETDQLFKVGDMWRGLYTCQGEQPFTLRIISVRDPAETQRSGNGHQAGGSDSAERAASVRLQAVFEFTHTGSTGSYVASGRYIGETRQLQFLADEWIKHPSGFSSVDLHGRLSDDGLEFFGLLPECFLGPFSATRAPRTSVKKTRDKEPCSGPFCQYGCRQERGPFGLDCLQALWVRAGCSDLGAYAPLRAPDVQLRYWQSLDIYRAFDDMRWYVERAKSGVRRYNRLCHDATLSPDATSKTDREGAVGTSHAVGRRKQPTHEDADGLRTAIRKTLGDDVKVKILTVEGLDGADEMDLDEVVEQLQTVIAQELEDGQGEYADPDTAADDRDAETEAEERPSPEEVGRMLASRVSKIIKTQLRTAVDQAKQSDSRMRQTAEKQDEQKRLERGYQYRHRPR